MTSEGALFRYRAEVLDELWRHGIQPTASTKPETVRDFVRDLYKYEIRQLRGRMVRHEFPKAEYADRVLALRDRYPILSLLPRQFIE